MVSSKIKHLQKIYEEKYGVMGKVASRYLNAGYSVTFNHPTRYGLIPVVVYGKGLRIAIEVIEKSGYIDINIVKNLIEKAKLLKAKPMLILCSDGPRLSDEIRKLCKDNGVKIRRIKTK